MKEQHLRRTLGYVTALVVLGVGPGVAFADMFQITIENLSPNVLSPVPFITHDGSFDLFDAGAAASAEIEAVAEAGDASGVEGLANAALGTSVLAYGLANAAPLTMGQSGMVTIEADPAHPWLSFVSMMGISNDAFIGVAAGDGAIDLFPGGSPFNGVITVMPDDVWDAGTEVNDELATTVGALGGMGGVDENGVITRPHPGITGVGDIPLDVNWTGGPVARITIVPEPASLALLAIGGVLGVRRRRR